MKRFTPEEKYKYKLRKQDKILEEFVTHEVQWAYDLIMWYRVMKKEMPDDEYRACAFLTAGEYLHKPGSLTLLYQMYHRCLNELPKPTKELAFDLLAFRFKNYAMVLEKGGYYGA